MVKHDIRAELSFDPKGAQRGFNQAAEGAHRVERSIYSAQNAADGLVRKLLTIGTAYLSINGAVNVFARLTSSAFKYTGALEATKIGLSSVMSAVENVPWEKATKMAEGAFERIKKMSIESPGSAQDMFGIFNGIVGPVRAAGASLETVYKLTNDTTLAAAALGVDFQQASRDINMMARGTAGVDVKMFSLLKSTGAIKEDTEQWNKSLTAAQRVEKLGAALQKFAGSGEAFGKSWAGVMSTFEGLTDELKRTTFQPLMRSIAATTDRLNTVLVKHGERIGYSFNHLGTSMARFWDSTAGRLDFDRVMLGVEAGALKVSKALQTASGWADALVANWGKLSAGLTNSMPMLKVIAGAYLGHKLMGGAGGLLGAGVPGGGGGGGGKSGGGGLWGAAAASSHMAQGAVAGTAGGPLASMAVGKGAGMIGYKTALLGSIMTAGIAAPGLFAQAYVNDKAEQAKAGGGGGGGDAGAGGAAGSFTALANSISAAIVVTEHWTRINAALGPVVAETEASTTQLAVASAKAGHAVGRVWGQIEVFAGGLVTALAPAVNTLSQALAGVLDHVTIWADKINYYLAPAFDYAIGKLGEFASALSSFLAPIAKFFQVTAVGDDSAEINKAYDLPEWASGSMQAAKALATPDARKPSVVNNVNASGARVTIKQEFGNQDPDRVVSLMMLDLERQAESRISSAFSGALTR